MKKEEITKKIKVFLGIVKDKFQTAKLTDGSEISFDSLEIDREVYDADGNALKEGEYVLEDGTKFVVDGNGIIKEIVEPKDEETKDESKTEAMSEENKDAEAEKPTTEPTNDLSDVSVEDRITQLENKVDELYELLLAITEKIQVSDTKVEETVEEFKKLKSQPSATPLHFAKSEGDAPMTRIEKLKMLKNNK